VAERFDSAPVETAVAGRYLPALDGLRALAILAVIAYHLNYGWASGGYLGVDLFFVLSGFLITSLLVEEREGTGRVKLAAFWGRRARRLLPALLVMLAALSIWVAVNPGRTDLSQLRGDGLATIFYFANWHLLLAHQNYFTQFQAPSPLAHTWSLAIEEQFYLVWPFVVLAVLGWRGSRRAGDWRRTGSVVTIGGTVLSAAWMAYLWHSGAGIDRVYYGTDTRAFDLLVGASAAMIASYRPQPSSRVRKLLHVASPVCLVVFVVVWVLGGARALSGDSGFTLPNFMFYGGFLIFALAAAVLVSDVRQLDRGPVGRLLSLRPLRWVGRISYGLYLWHLPVIVELNSQRLGFSGVALAAVQVAVTFAVSALSFYLIERPIRRTRLSRIPKPTRVGIAPAGMALTAVAVLLATVPAAAAPSQVVEVSPKAPGAGRMTAQRAVDHNIVLPPGVGTRSRPLRILLVGDSVMETQAPAIEAAFDSTGDAQVSSIAIAGWGLTIAKNWATQVPKFIRQRRPDLVVAMWGWDNGCLLEPRPPGTCSLSPAQYKTQLVRFIDVVLAPGDGVSGLMFEQYPPLGPLFSPTENRQRVQGELAWDALVASMPAQFPGRVMYLPVGPAVEHDGKFADWLPPENDPGAPESTWVRVRMMDNTHFCPAGAARYAGALLSDLTILYHLGPPSSDWSTAAWTHDSWLFDTPAGSCPDDHP
jgi:peptidoglycan/LPS O-acetylase OafA/YrhL